MGNAGTEATFDRQNFPSPHAVCIRNGKRLAEGVSHLLLAEMEIEGSVFNLLVQSEANTR